MKNLKKKGFTIVELVIVIAVIAILSAVLIPTFSNLVKKANISADQQAVASMNKYLKIDEVENGKPANVDEVVEVLINNDYNSDLTTYYNGYTLAWLTEENMVVLVEENKVVYPTDYVGQTNYKLLIPMVKEVEDLLNSLEPGETVFLNGDIDKQIRIDSNEIDSKININGHSLINNTGNVVNVFNGKIEFKNGTIKSAGKDYHVVATTGNANVVLDNINVIGQNDPSKNMLAIKTYSSTTTITIKNSMFTLINCGGVEAANGGTINLSNVIMSRSGEVEYSFIKTAVAASNNGTVNINGGKYSGDASCLFIYSSGGTINITDGEFSATSVIDFTLDKNTYPNAVSEMYISGGKFNGKINMYEGCKLEISGGEFVNTGLSIEEFEQYVRPGNYVVEENGVYIVK